MAIFDILAQMGLSEQVKAPPTVLPTGATPMNPNGNVIWDANRTSAPAQAPMGGSIFDILKQQAMANTTPAVTQSGIQKFLGGLPAALETTLSYTATDPYARNLYQGKVAKRLEQEQLKDQQHREALEKLAVLEQQQQQMDAEKAYRQEQLDLERQKISASQNTPDTQVGKLLMERDRIASQNPNDSRLKVYDEAIQKATKPDAGTTINLNTGINEQNKTIGEFEGKLFSETQAAAKNAAKLAQDYGSLDTLLQNVNTGKYKGTTTDIKKAAKTFGIDLESIGITDDVAPVEAARAIQNQIALSLRNPSAGEGMPGAMSDQDRNFLNQIPPGIEFTPEGRKIAVKIQNKKAERARELAKMARQYRKENGGFDAGFEDLASAYNAVNPLFDETFVEEIQRVSGGTSAPATQAKIKMFNPSTGKIE